MDTALHHALLADLAKNVAGATSVPSLLSDAVPLVHDLAGAKATVVVRGPADGPTTLAGAGAALPLEALGTVLSQDGTPPVPAAWQVVGVAHVLRHDLPADAGSLIVTWAEQRDSVPPQVSCAFALVDATVARLAAEERLADLAQRVDLAQQLANMGDYDWHIASDTNRWSDQLYRIYGHAPQSFNASYERFLDQIHPDDRARITAIHQHAYATGEPYQMIERIVRPSGEVRYLSSNGQVVMDEFGTPIRMRGTCVDITERVLAEQAHERISRRFRSLVEAAPDGILVYDRSRTVVQANGAATALLRTDPVGHSVDVLLPPHRDGQLGIAASAADGTALLLDVWTAPLTDVDGEDLVEVRFRDARPRLDGEAAAARLTEVKVRRRQALEINDNVIQGLSAASYALLLGDAERASGYLDSTLSAARKMMNNWLEPLGGDEVQPGDLVREAPSTLGVDSVPEPGSDQPKASARPRIVIADDFEDVRMLLKLQLQRTGRFDVVAEAANGEEAVELATRLQPDVVLLDMSMPRMDGLQALPLIREAVPGVRVLVLSGFDEGSMAKKALDLGADGYVEKGLRMNLADVIDGVLTGS